MLFSNGCWLAELWTELSAHWVLQRDLNSGWPCKYEMLITAWVDLEREIRDNFMAFMIWEVGMVADELFEH